MNLIMDKTEKIGTGDSFNLSVVKYLVPQCKKNCRSACCRTALLYGMLLFSRGRTDELSSSLLDWLMTAAEKRGEVFVIEDFNRIDRRYFSCSECGRYFLCGVFLSSGSVGDPKRDYRLEITIPRDEDGGTALADDLEAYLREIDLLPLRHKPSKGAGAKNTVLYLRQAEKVEDFLNYIGASTPAFEALNTRIHKQYRNEANRITNCETSNIDRAVNAAQKQIRDIELLIESGKLADMDDGLRQTAQLRIENPFVSLQELASMHRPPITKSGVVHRLRKLSSAAKEL